MVKDMDFCDANNGWVVGWFGYVARSTDRGRNGSVVNVGSEQLNFSAVHCVSPQEVWIVSFQGAVYHTYNGGQTWVRETASGYPFALPAFMLRAWEMCGQVGLWCAIYRRTLPEIVAPETFSLGRGAVVSGGNW